MIYNTLKKRVNIGFIGRRWVSYLLLIMLVMASVLPYISSDTMLAESPDSSRRLDLSKTVDYYGNNTSYDSETGVLTINDLPGDDITFYITIVCIPLPGPVEYGADVTVDIKGTSDHSDNGFAIFLCGDTNFSRGSLDYKIQGIDEGPFELTGNVTAYTKSQAQSESIKSDPISWVAIKSLNWNGPRITGLAINSIDVYYSDGRDIGSLTEPTATPTAEPTATPTAEPTASVEKSDKYDMVKDYYIRGLWYIDRVRNAVEMGYITEEEFYEITGKIYVSPEPSPGVIPTETPTAKPTDDPIVTPTVEPTTRPTEAPSALSTTQIPATNTASLSDEKKDDKSDSIKKGMLISSGNLLYKVTKAKKGKYEVAVKKVKNQKCKTVNINGYIKYKGIKFKVTCIGKRFAYGCTKLKTINIKSKYINKIEKKALDGIKSKYTIFVVKSKLKKLTKMLKKSK